MNREYRVRPGRVFGLVVVIAFVTMAPLLPLWSAIGSTEATKWLVTVVLLALFLILSVRAGRSVTVIDADGIHIRTLSRTRHLAWSDIQDFRSAPSNRAPGQSDAPNTVTYAHTHDGRRVLLPYADDRHVDVDQEIRLLRTALRRTG
ncbi:PH domain-containing protein [Streptomyces sp. NPDC088258]|uniref:PH domain-containing protein n=1 Tax=Streptomyces sp. NPDC088258 TaxID=3365849 RepID=UPI003813D06B